MPAQAQSSGTRSQARNATVRLHLDEATQAKGFSLFSQDHNLTLGVPPDSLPARHRIRVSLKRRGTIPKQIRKHGDQELYSPVYSFDVYNKQTVWPLKPLWLKLHYVGDADVSLSLAYWDSHAKKWILLSSQHDSVAQTVTAGVSIPYALIALVETPPDHILESGLASWYTSEYAAHRTLPFGTLLKVTNTDNGKGVIVEVGDRGPFIDGRILDLPVFAFEQIASLGAGVIPITVELVSLP